MASIKKLTIGQVLYDLQLDLGIELGGTYTDNQFHATLGVSLGVIGTSQTN